MPDFSAILDKPASEIERPKPLPVGTYRTIVRGMPEYGESSQKKTPFARFTLEILRAEDDVDQEALDEMGGCEGKTLRHEIYASFDDRKQQHEFTWRAKEFAEHCGVDVDSQSIGQCFEACNGAQVMVTVRHEPARDGSDAIFARIGRTGPV